MATVQKTINLTFSGAGTSASPLSLTTDPNDPTIIVIKPGDTLQLTLKLTSTATNVTNVGLYPSSTTFSWLDQEPVRITYQSVTGPTNSVWAKISNPLTSSALKGGDAKGIEMLLEPTVQFDDASGTATHSTDTAVQVFAPVVYNEIKVESDLQFTYTKTGSRTADFKDESQNGIWTFTVKNQRKLSVLFELGTVPANTVFDSGKTGYSPTWWYDPSDAYSSAVQPSGYDVERISDTLFLLKGTNNRNYAGSSTNKFRIVLKNSGANHKTLIVAPDPTIVEEGISTY